MDLAALRLFVEVAHRCSFAAVARQWDLDPSSVARTIAGLECDLGTRLFQRTTRRMSLSEAGALYLERIEPLLDQLDEAREEVRRTSAEPSGTLRLTTSIAFGTTVVVPRLPAFRARFAAIGLEMVLSDAPLDLVAERIDLAIRLGPRPTGDGIATRLMDTRYAVVASPSYLAKAPPLAVPGDLGAHRCLLFDLPAFRSRWRFRHGEGPVEEVAVDGDLVVSNALALREAAIQGLGPALLADWLTKEPLAQGDLVAPLARYAVTATEFETAAWLIYPSRSHLPAKVRAMIDFLREALP